MPAFSSPVTPSPVAIKRLPWMRRLSFIIPRLSRLLTLFSYGSLSLWAYVESHSAASRVLVERSRLRSRFACTRILLTHSHTFTSQPL